MRTGWRLRRCRTCSRTRTICTLSRSTRTPSKQRTKQRTSLNRGRHTVLSKNSLLGRVLYDTSPSYPFLIFLRYRRQYEHSARRCVLARKRLKRRNRIIWHSVGGSAFTKLNLLITKISIPLQKFINERGKIVSRRVTGLSAKQQRMVTRAVKRARNMALLPFTQ